MAKKVTTQDIINMSPKQLRELPLATLKKYASQVGSTVNKRVDRLDKKSIIYTPAKSNLDKSGGKISIAGKNKNQILGEIWRSREFLNSKTSTLSGAKKFVEYASEKVGGKLTEENAQKFWETYRKIEEMYSKEIIKHHYGSDELQSYLRNEVVEKPDSSIDELIETVSEEFENSYNETDFDEDDFFSL